ncbi:hypothetical protein EYR41_003376 [Orbilia oligospora]|uniref:Uncharacterized protein n=1 Tax=Orbilia oligospora TaxID=2813651 RepID=A0A7C8PV70_ORBOL|nr:hypothetical protein TWF751_010162 [Orbilia oligospora]TGJ71410.1 hypothetical protein EYR41_003376 [Orbilia oligospora]
MSDQGAISIFPAIGSEDLISLSSPPQHSPDEARSPSPFVMPSPIGEGESPISTTLANGHNFEIGGFLGQYEDIHEGIHRPGHVHGSPPSRASSGLASQIFPERIFQHFQEFDRGSTEVPEAEVSGNTEFSDLGPTGQDLASRLEQLYLQAINSAPTDDSDRFEILTTSTSSDNIRDRIGSFSEAIRGPTPPLPPPDIFSSDVERDPQMDWEGLKAKMSYAYKEKLDNGILDSLTIQNTDDFVFFDVKYTHIGDYLEIGFARTPVQVCLMKYSGEIIYQANLAMFDPRNGKEVLSMIQWLDLVLDYQCTGAMSRRWYDVTRMDIAIANMRGYFWSTEVPRRTIHQMKNDLKAFNFRHKILFTHDGNLRPYDILRKLLPEATLPPRLVTMSSYKLIKIILPEMPLDLYEFFYHLVDLDTFDDPTAPVLHKHVATDDTTYIRQIFSFFVRAWESFQSEEDGRPREDAPERLVDVWEGIPPDSPLFEPVSESDNDEDMGMTLSEVEAFELEAEQEEDLISMEELETRSVTTPGLTLSGTHESENFNTFAALIGSKSNVTVAEIYRSAGEEHMQDPTTSLRSDLWDYD